MKTFDQWVQNENMFGWLLGKNMPPMNPMQRQNYAALRKTGMGHEETLKTLGISMTPPKTPMPGENGFNASFIKGGDEFSSPSRMALNKAPSITK